MLYQVPSKSNKLATLSLYVAQRAKTVPNVCVGVLTKVV